MTCQHSTYSVFEGLRRAAALFAAISATLCLMRCVSASKRSARDTLAAAGGLPLPEGDFAAFLAGAFLAVAMTSSLSAKQISELAPGPAGHHG